MNLLWQNSIGYIITPIGVVLRYYKCPTCEQVVDPKDNWLSHLSTRLKESGLPAKEFLTEATITPPPHKCRA